VAAAFGLAWVIAWRRHSGWDFIIGIVLVLLIGAGVSEVVGMRKRKAETAHLPKPTPIEWVGIDRPFEEGDRDQYDRELAYREVV
jgi:hypothetical protein